MATISNNNLIQPVYVPTIAQMTNVPLQLGRLYYIVDINALWLYTNDALGAPSETNGVYNAGGGVFFGLAKGSALTGTNAEAANLGAERPSGVPIIDTSWLPGTVDEIVEVWINREVPLNDPDLFAADQGAANIIVGKAKTIYLVVGQTTQSTAYDHESRVNHSFRWGETQYVDLDNDEFTLNELTNVTISNPSNNQVLTYDSNTSKWRNQPLPTADATLGLSTLGIVLRTGANTYSTQVLGSGNQYLRMDGNGELEWHTLDVGVTSVGLQMPSGFTVNNSPITDSGTFNVSITGPVTFANPSVPGNSSIVLGHGSDDNQPIGAWEFLTSGTETTYNGINYKVVSTAPSGTDSGPAEVYFNTANNEWYYRPAGENTGWMSNIFQGYQVGSSMPTGEPGTSLPFTQSKNGMPYYKTNATGGAQGIYVWNTSLGPQPGDVGGLYYNATIDKVRLRRSEKYVSLLDEDDIANLYWMVIQ